MSPYIDPTIVIPDTEMMNVILSLIDSKKVARNAHEQSVVLNSMGRVGIVFQRALWL